VKGAAALTKVKTRAGEVFSLLASEILKKRNWGGSERVVGEREDQRRPRHLCLFRTEREGRSTRSGGVRLKPVGTALVRNRKNGGSRERESSLSKRGGELNQESGGGRKNSGRKPLEIYKKKGGGKRTKIKHLKKRKGRRKGE